MNLCSLCNDEFDTKNVGDVNISIFGINKKFMIYTGSCINVIDEKTFNSFEKKPFLEKYHIPAYSYDSSNPLHILCRFQWIIKFIGLILW